MPDSDTNYPEDRAAGDYLHSIVQAAAGAVPVLGGLLSEVIEQTWIPSLQRRQAEWLAEVGLDLEALSGEVSDLRARLESDEFLEVFLEAQRAAQRTHESEKREALRNAVVNTALGVEEDQAWRLIFIDRLAELQPAHLQLLAFLSDPRQGLVDRGIQPPELMMGGAVSPC